MSEPGPTVLLRGIELRYVLTAQLFRHGPASVAQLADALAAQGFRVRGRASKAISDALRWEREYGRVRRLARGVYGPRAMPRGTEHRIHHRVEALRDRADPQRHALGLTSPRDWTDPRGRPRTRRIAPLT